MKKTLLILPVLLISLCALAATDPQSEKQAEEFYREGKYNEAAEIYRKLRASGMESAILYYNLGNCYYKLGENTQAILNYERALLLDPSDASARYNLKMAQQAIVDKIEVLPELFLVVQRFCRLFFRRSVGIYLGYSLYPLFGDGSFIFLFSFGRYQKDWFCRGDYSLFPDCWDDVFCHAAG